MWTKRSAWLHWLLAAYLWLISWFPLGNWNRQHDETLLPQLLEGKGLHVDDIGMLVFVTAPALLFWLGYRYRNFWLAVAALAFDLFWAAMQIQSWWIPYLFGTNVPWQLRYAKGPTTKVLPSFGNHVAPDGMHFLIHVFLAAAFITGTFALRELWRKRLAPEDVLSRGEAFSQSVGGARIERPIGKMPQAVREKTRASRRDNRPS